MVDPAGGGRPHSNSHFNRHSSPHSNHLIDRRHSRHVAFPGRGKPPGWGIGTSGFPGRCVRAVSELNHVPAGLNQPSCAPTSTLNAVVYDDSGGAAKTAGSRATRLGEHDGRGGTKKPAESHATCLTRTIACSSIGFKLSSIWGVRHLGFPSRINYQASSRCER